jgi:hypothetical protein
MVLDLVPAVFESRHIQRCRKGGVVRRLDGQYASLASVEIGTTRTWISKLEQDTNRTVRPSGYPFWYHSSLYLVPAWYHYRGGNFRVSPYFNRQNTFKFALPPLSLCIFTRSPVCSLIPVPVSLKSVIFWQSYCNFSGLSCYFVVLLKH